MDIGLLVRSTRTEIGRSHRDRPALTMRDETWTYAELDERSTRYANALRGFGVRAGDHIAVFMYNSLDYMAAYLAVVSLRAVVVRVNFRLQSEELRFVLENSNSVMVLVDADLLPSVEPLRAALPVREYVVFGESADDAHWTLPHSAVLAGSPDPSDLELPAGDDPAMLMYTSGTTGTPKGALWTHEGTMWHAALQALHYGYDASTVTLTTGPLYHVGALENVTSACLFVHGHALLTPSGNFDSAAVLQDIERHGVTDLFAFPFMVSDVLHNRRAQNHDLSSLRRVICGGTGTPSWAARETERQMPGAKLLLGYGMTESGTNATIDPALGLRTADPVDAIGIPLAGYEVQVRNLEGSECEPGVDGEIFVRGPSVCIGYWRDEEATERTFGDGWCRTGDLGQVTDGLLRITGRVKDMIRTGGENVYPAEVEAVLTVHKDILEAAVIGIPDARLEEAVCAVVLRREGATITDVEVIDFVRDRLAGYKKPRHVVFVDDLPRNPSGKVLKYMLRDRYASLGAGPVPVPAVEAEGDR